MSFDRSITSDSGNFSSGGEDSKSQSSIHKLERSYNSGGDDYGSGTRGLNNLTTDHNQDHRGQIRSTERSYTSNESGSAQSKDRQSMKDMRGLEKSKPGEAPAPNHSTRNMEMSITGRHSSQLRTLSKD